MAFVTHHCARGCGRVVPAAGRTCPPLPKVTPATCWPPYQGEAELKAEMARDQAHIRSQPSVFDKEIAAAAKADLEERKARNAGR